MEISKSKRTWIIIGAVLMTATVQLSSAGLNNTMYAILSGMNGLQYYALLATLSSLGMAIMCVIGGRIGDMIGRRAVILAGAVLSLASAIVMGLAQSLSVFIVARAVLSFGIGTFPQVNAIVDSMQISFGFPKIATDVILTVFIAAITLGGLQSIAKVASGIVPFMALTYVAISLGLIILNLDQVPAAIAMIINDAFTGAAAAGGFAGSTVMMAMQNGVARGVFSNESGLGSAPIAAAAAKTKWPAEQGLISMTGTFIDTIIICSMTGLALVLTGVWQGDAAGAAMTSAAFASAYGFFGSQLLTIALVLFAFTTILGWNYYGERACIYLFGNKGVLPYRLIFIALIASGAFLKLEAIWILADIVNGLMAIPNLIALIALSGVIVAETNKYMNRHKKAAQPSSDK